MTHHAHQGRLGLRLAVGLLLCCLLIVIHSAPAIASIHKYPESNTQVMYRSQQSLRDASGKAWQAILFKRLNSGQVDCVHLRLIGFPGLTEVAHPEQLRITTRTGEVEFAKDVLVATLPSNVGEYDFLKVVNHLDKNKPLQLGVALKGGQRAELLVPPFAVREWRDLLEKF